MTNNLNRRNFIRGLGLFCAAPAIVPYASLMPVKLFEPTRPPYLVSPGVYVREIDYSYTILPQETQSLIGFDVEAELSRILSEQITRQINQEIINTLQYEPLRSGRLIYHSSPYPTLTLDSA